MNKKIDFLNFDSINAATTSNDSFDATFTLAQKYKNIHKIYLKNCEIPIGFPNIRSQNYTNIFSFNLNGVRYDCLITPGSFTNISNFLLALNLSISNALVGVPFTLYISATTDKKMQISCTGASAPYSVIKTTLSDILGLSSAKNQNVTTVYSSPYAYNLA